jgi:hypothetical protein
LTHTTVDGFKIPDIPLARKATPKNGKIVDYQPLATHGKTRPNRQFEKLKNSKIVKMRIINNLHHMAKQNKRQIVPKTNPDA